MAEGRRDGRFEIEGLAGLVRLRIPGYDKAEEAARTEEFLVHFVEELVCPEEERTGKHLLEEEGKDAAHLYRL